METPQKPAFWRVWDLKHKRRKSHETIRAGRRRPLAFAANNAWERITSALLCLCGIYIRRPAIISFSYGDLAMLPGAVRSGLQQYDLRDDVMSLASRYQELAGHDVAATTSALMDDILGSSRRESPALERDHRRARIEDLMRSGARIDAALELIALELPQWQLRRIAYDAGEWHCALSRMRELPDWLDRSVEGRHADLALAVLEACLEARGSSEPRSAPHVPPADAGAATMPFCCDNFA